MILSYVRTSHPPSLQNCVILGLDNVPDYHQKSGIVGWGCECLTNMRKTTFGACALLPRRSIPSMREEYLGIYQPNLFRTLPNRSRLLELINIFDSEKQPSGSVIRSRQPLRH